MSCWRCTVRMRVKMPVRPTLIWKNWHWPGRVASNSLRKVGSKGKGKGKVKRLSPNTL
jgi:hypothetical protein